MFDKIHGFKGITVVSFGKGRESVGVSCIFGCPFPFYPHLAFSFLPNMHDIG